MDRHDDQALAKHLEYTHKMAAAFQNVANIYYRNGIPKEPIASVFFAASVDSLLLVFEPEIVVGLLQGTIDAVKNLDQDELKADIMHCKGSA